MKIDQWKLADVKPYEKNPRINDNAVESVAGSIREFGFRQPIVVDGDGVIVVATRDSRRLKNWASRKCPFTSPRDSRRHR